MMARRNLQSARMAEYYAWRASWWQRVDADPQLDDDIDALVARHGAKPTFHAFLIATSHYADDRLTAPCNVPDTRGTTQDIEPEF